ncbi:MAG: MBL fold metallo-hydrolase [Candidatus Binatia bacterium]|nr:MAG: MBL fold metallo-hydrolase [Candidatus Binatia bacterium]
MFGHVPRSLWQRWVRPDAENRIPLATRCLLVEEDGGRRILFEAGIGLFFPPELRRRYGVVENEHVLLRRLGQLGVRPEEIDVVVLSHLHFDHAGGVLAPWDPGRTPDLCFPRARFVVSRGAWERALRPHLRDRASFVPELPDLLEKTRRLEIVDGPVSETLGGHYRFVFSEGHTPGLMLALFDTEDGPILYASDLVPGKAWVHLPVTMGYDRYPELLVDEKRRIFDELLPAGGWLFFTHDPDTARCRIERDPEGRYRASESQADVEGVELRTSRKT